MILQKILKESRNKIFVFLFHKNINDILPNLNTYDIISFDIFDTLINRTCRNSEDIFDYVELIYNLTMPHKKIENFKKNRIYAFKKTISQSKFEEVTLKEIYSNINGYTELEKDFLQKIEVNLELLLCKPNNNLYKIYSELVRLNKEIIVTSDMYLPLDIIEKILEKNGYNEIKKIFLSSELRLTKWRGNIFEKVLYYKKNKKIVHIGDNPISDYIQPRKKGIDAILIKSKKEKDIFGIKNKTLDQKLLNSFISANIKIQDNIYSQFGYKIFGPLLFGFTSWLHNELRKEKIDKVFFLARDAKIIMKSYQMLYPNNQELKYLNISRKSIILSELDNVSSFEELYDKLKSILKNTATVNDLYSLININSHLFEDKLIAELLPLEKKEIFKSIQYKLIKYSKMQKDLFNIYLNQNGFNGKVALVDIGWRGTTQYLLSKKKQAEDISGFYFGINADKNFDEYKSLNRNGYLFDNLLYNSNQSVVSLNVGLFESLFLAQEGTTLGYKEIDKKVIPILDKKHALEKNILLIQKAALSFINDIKKSNLENILCHFNSDVFFSNFKYVATKPQNKIIKMFKDISFEAHDKKNLVTSKSILYYLFHIKEFLIDFNNSYCKIMFLKNIFKIPFHYYTILDFLYKRTKI